jgi:hypothetical protein
MTGQGKKKQPNTGVVSVAQCGCELKDDAYFFGASAGFSGAGAGAGASAGFCSGAGAGFSGAGAIGASGFFSSAFLQPTLMVNATSSSMERINAKTFFITCSPPSLEYCQELGLSQFA